RTIERHDILAVEEGLRVIVETLSIVITICIQIGGSLNHPIFGAETWNTVGYNLIIGHGSVQRSKEGGARLAIEVIEAKAQAMRKFSFQIGVTGHRKLWRSEERRVGNEGRYGRWPDR